MFWVGLWLIGISSACLFAYLTWFSLRLTTRFIKPMQASAQKLLQDSQAVSLEYTQSVSVRVLHISESGTTINDSPLVVFDLAVIPPNGNAYRLEMKRLTSLLEIPRIQPGAFIPALSHPHHPEAITLLLDQEPTNEEVDAIAHAQERNLSYDDLPRVQSLSSDGSDITANFTKNMMPNQLLVMLAIAGCIAGSLLMAIGSLIGDI